MSREKGTIRNILKYKNKYNKSLLNSSKLCDIMTKTVGCEGEEIYEKTIL